MRNPAIETFIANVVAVGQNDENILGLALAGSAITGETDKYSDIDLVVVTASAIAPDRMRMREFAAQFSDLISESTGEHVGERRLLICLYDNPLLHVDFKFLTAVELDNRIENPVVLFERQRILSNAYQNTEPRWPVPDLQWIEDRFWVWIHYAATKIGRGEFLETCDHLAAIRGMVLGPMLHMKYGQLPRGVRKLEKFVDPADISKINQTIGRPERAALIMATQSAIDLYLCLRTILLKGNIDFRAAAQKAATEYLASV